MAKNIVVAAGLHKQVKDEYFRIGHMGVTVVNDKQRGDIDHLLNSIKEALAEAGYKPLDGVTAQSQLTLASRLTKSSTLCVHRCLCSLDQVSKLQEVSYYDIDESRLTLCWKLVFCRLTRRIRWSYRKLLPLRGRTAAKKGIDVSLGSLVNVLVPQRPPSHSHVQQPYKRDGHLSPARYQTAASPARTSADPA